MPGSLPDIEDFSLSLEMIYLLVLINNHICTLMALLLPLINQLFNGIIWRLEIDELSETLFIEVRNEQEKQVSFSAVSLNSGETYFKDLVTPERWLTGMEAAYNGVLLLHNYQSENGPLHKGVIAVDALSGETLWSNYTCVFDHLSANGPVLYDTRMQPRKLFLADVKTGATIGPYQPSAYDELASSIVVPEQPTPDDLTLPLPPFGNSVHYLEYNNFRIVSLHTIQAEALQQWLYVMDGTGIIYEDLLNTDIQKLQPEAFILHKNRLIYIKNKSQLIVINL